MFETILVATDGSHSAGKAVDFAVEFAKSHGSKLVICTVTRERLATIDRDPGEPNPPDVDPRASLSRGQADQSAEVLRRGEQAAKAAGLGNYDLREIYGTNTGATIVKEAEAMEPTTSSSALSERPASPGCSWVRWRRAWCITPTVR